MSRRSAFVDAAVQTYIAQVSPEEPEVLRDLRAETAALPNAGMQIGIEQGQFMALLAHLIDARRYLEIGVFTGCSSLVMALALPQDGRIVACDVSAEYTAMARRYWQRAGVAAKVDLRLGPALETLAALRAEGAAPFDLAFIDADKVNVVAYYEAALGLLRPGGLILVDNVLWGGAVADAAEVDEDTVALRAVATHARDDARVESTLLPVGDGLLLARKR